MECVGLFGKLFGHNYEQIFNIQKGEPNIKEVSGYRGYGGGPTVIDIIEASREVKSEFLFSRCSRCGRKLDGAE